MKFIAFSLSFILVLVGCGGGSTTDSGTTDSGTTDSGTTDSGTTDSGTTGSGGGGSTTSTPAPTTLSFQDSAGTYDQGACYTSDNFIEASSNQAVNIKESLTVDYDTTGPTLENINGYTTTFYAPADTNCSGTPLETVTSGAILGQNDGTISVSFDGQTVNAHKVDVYAFTPTSLTKVVIPAGASSVNLATGPRVSNGQITRPSPTIMLVINNEMYFGDLGSPLDAEGYPSQLLSYSRLKRN